MDLEQDALKIEYFKITDIWKKLCDEHSKIYDITCDEYSALLENDIDGLNDIVQEKDKVIKAIEHLDKYRYELIDNLNRCIPSDVQITGVLDLINFFSLYEEKVGKTFLQDFNELLIDIIQKIQVQNKTNQVFLNKAMLNLDKLRRDTLGIKGLTTYTSKGEKNTSSLP